MTLLQSRVLYTTKGSGKEIEQKRSREPTPSGESQTVLVVEDNRSIRRLTCRLLAAEGYKTLQAADGQEALSICERHTAAIDLVISDVVMPRLGGRALAQRLRRRYPHMRVLFVSGDHSERDDTLSFDGADFALLSKPFEPEDLISRVREILGPTES